MLQDVEKAIAKGGWTTNEWNRLHALQRIWTARHTGQDLAFNLRGWKKQGTGHHTPSVEKTIQNIKKEIAQQCGFTTSDRGR